MSIPVAARTRTVRAGLAVLLLLAAVTATTLGVGRRAAAAPTLHVWLHYDYLVGAPDGHSDAPDPAAIQLVVDAFAKHDIGLEIDNHHNEIPWKPYISMVTGCESSDTLGLPDVEAQYFHPTANHEWHYALFGDRVKMREDCQTIVTGQAELPGDTFVIGMAPFNRDRYNVGAAFMHELGHNLNLHHGGFEDLNYKPNYLSVMNYQFVAGGIPYAAAPGSTTIVGRRLDYSDVALPTLDEAHLNETVGIQGGPTDTDVTRWPAVFNSNASSYFGFGPAHGPIDWNLDGTATDTDVQEEVNYDIFSPLSPPDYTLLRGFDDWAEVRAFLLGTIDPGPKTIATEGEADEPIVTGISPTSGPAIGGTTVTITGTHLGKAIAVYFAWAGPASFSIVDDKTITAVAPPAKDPGGSTGDIMVFSPGPVSNFTGYPAGTPSPSVPADVFTYTSVLPVITSVSPASGSYGTIFKITGSHFTGATFVGLGQNADRNSAVIDDATISTVVPILNQLTSPTTFDVRVKNAYGWSSVSANDQFTYLPIPPAPTITSVSPTSGPASGGTTIVIKGTGFSQATSVSQGDSVNSFSLASFTFIDDSTISAVTPNVISAASGGQIFGTVDVRVTTPGGTSALTLADQFTYLPPGPASTPTPTPTPTPATSPPTVSGFTPSSGPAGTVITITGTNLTGPGGASVLFAGCSAAATVTATANADGSLSAAVPACAQTGPLTVFTAGGSATSAQTFTVTS